MNKTERIRKNPYIASTIIFGGVLLLLLINDVYWHTQEQEDWEGEVCSNMIKYKIGTPAYFNHDGNLIYEGYIPLVNSSRDKIEEVFIDDRITFVYKEGCGWCGKQIEEFKEYGLWENYQKEKLTISCP